MSNAELRTRKRGPGGGLAGEGERSGRVSGRPRRHAGTHAVRRMGGETRQSSSPVLHRGRAEIEADGLRRRRRRRRKARVKAKAKAAKRRRSRRAAASY